MKITDNAGAPSSTTEPNHSMRALGRTSRALLRPTTACEAGAARRRPRAPSAIRCLANGAGGAPWCVRVTRDGPEQVQHAWCTPESGGSGVSAEFRRVVIVLSSIDRMCSKPLRLRREPSARGIVGGKHEFDLQFRDCDVLGGAKMCKHGQKRQNPARHLQSRGDGR